MLPVAFVTQTFEFNTSHWSQQRADKSFTELQLKNTHIDQFESGRIVDRGFAEIEFSYFRCHSFLFILRTRFPEQ